jgi:hypothetical protein
MRRVLAVLIVALAVSSSSFAADWDSTSTAAKIDIHESFFGSKFTYKGTDVTPAPLLREVFRTRPMDLERDALLAKSENNVVVGNVLGIIGAIVGGACLGAGRTGPGVAFTGLMVVGIGFTVSANNDKKAAVVRFNTGLGR